MTGKDSLCLNSPADWRSPPRFIVVPSNLFDVEVNATAPETPDWEWRVHRLLCDNLAGFASETLERGARGWGQAGI
jgi:hypothetical protein